MHAVSTSAVTDRQRLGCCVAIIKGLAPCHLELADCAHCCTNQSQALSVGPHSFKGPLPLNPGCQLREAYRAPTLESRASVAASRTRTCHSRRCHSHPCGSHNGGSPPCCRSTCLLSKARVQENTGQEFNRNQTPTIAGAQRPSPMQHSSRHPSKMHAGNKPQRPRVVPVMGPDLASGLPAEFPPPKHVE